MENKSFVLSASSKTYRWKGKGLCSIKTFTNGDAWYKTGKEFFRVDGNSFLILNNETEYEIEIDNKLPVNSFCIFFEPKLLQDLNIIKTKSTSFLLDNFDFQSKEALFFERTYQHSTLNSRIFKKFQDLYPIMKEDKLWLSQSFNDLLNCLPGINEANLKSLQNLPLQKPGTRCEIYKRVLAAQEFLHYNIYSNPTLDEVSKVSLLSTNHLIRCFRQAFQVSPHQYLVNLKIQKAKELLSLGKTTVASVCELLSFTSVPTFSIVFKKHTGFPPGKFATKKGDF